VTQQIGLVVSELLLVRGGELFAERKDVLRRIEVEVTARGSFVYAWPSSEQ
jgi:hypothetical protein